MRGLGQNLRLQRWCAAEQRDHVSAILTHGEERVALFPGKSQGAPSRKPALCLMQSPWNTLMPTLLIACKLVPAPPTGQGSIPRSAGISQLLLPK